MNKTFHITLTGDHELSISDIWPDGDAPENPTVADVVAVMRQYGYEAARLALDWNLELDLEIDGERVKL